jgi:hypothetical protein
MKCIGPDEVSNFILKGCSEVFSPLLGHLLEVFPYYGNK